MMVPPVDEGLSAEVNRLRSAEQSGEPMYRLPLLIGGSAIAAVGVGAFAFGMVALGIALLVVGIAAAAAGGWTSLRAQGSSSDGEALRAAETRLVVAEQMRATAETQLDAARQRALDAGLPSDANELRRLADEVFEAERVSATSQRWEAERAELVADLEQATVELREALASRSLTVSPDASVSHLQSALADYRTACRARRSASTAASRRPDLEQALASRSTEEERYAADVERLKAIEQRVLEAVAVTRPEGVDPTDPPDELVRLLRQWLDDRATRRASMQTARREWDRLQALLDDRTLDERQAERDQFGERLEAMTIPSDAARTELDGLAVGLEHTVRELRLPQRRRRCSRPPRLRPKCE